MLRPLTISRSSTNNATAYSAAVYTVGMGAFSPELAFGARTPPERGELIGGHLMIEYNSRISLFSYFICKKSIKTLIKSLKWTQVDPETKSPLCINRLSLFGRAKKVFDNVQITMVLHPSLYFFLNIGFVVLWLDHIESVVHT